MKRTSRATSVSNANSPTLRRSERNLTSRKEDCHTNFPPPAAKKARRSKDSNKTEVPASLMSLNYDVQDKLLKYLDVQSLEALGKTCSHFDLMINGRYQTTVTLPFDEETLSDLKESKIFEKKPVLRLLSPAHYQVLSKFVENSMAAKKYLLDTQMCVLNLSQVQELDLVPDVLKIPEAFNPSLRSSGMWDCGQQLDLSILSELATQGCLRNISRLDILLSMENISRKLWKVFMPAMVSLVELNITVLERKAGALQDEEYIYGYLEEIIPITKATRLNLTILSQNKRIKKLEKVLCSDHIKKLHISAPCTFSLVLVMKNLTEVTMDLVNSEGSQDCCSYQGSKMNDRKIHRAGLCIIHIGTLFGRCPRLKNFNGIKIGKFSMTPTSLPASKESFTKWNRKVKLLFHKDYLLSGGHLDIKSWSRRRWFSRQPSIETEYGKARLPVSKR